MKENFDTLGCIGYSCFVKLHYSISLFIWLVSVCISMAHGLSCTNVLSGKVFSLNHQVMWTQSSLY